MSSEKCDSSQNSTGLNESWVELSMSSTSNKTSGGSTPRLTKLLVEAQKESGLNSRNSSSGTNSSKALDSPPLSTHSGSSDECTRPTIPSAELREFIQDWSSRPEIVPPSAYGKKLERPIKRHPLSVRNTRVMKEGWLSSENLPTLMFTHAASFAVGASLVCWYMLSKN